MMQIQSSSQNYKTAFLHLGFRPFFAGAAIFAIVSMSIWLMVYEFGLLVDFRTLPAILWHGHEMIYGYSMAVIAGFLLTAVRNWTGEMTLNGIGLLVLFMLWLLARVLHFIPLPYITVIAPVTDLLFMVLLFCRGNDASNKSQAMEAGRHFIGIDFSFYWKPVVLFVYQWTRKVNTTIWSLPGLLFNTGHGVYHGKTRGPIFY